MSRYSQKFDAKAYWANKPVCVVCKKHKTKNGGACSECKKKETTNKGDLHREIDLEKNEKVTYEAREVSQKASDVFKKYQQQAIDFSRRNRLLKYPTKATKIDFNLGLEECSGYFGNIEELSVSFPHKEIIEAEKKREKLEKQGQLLPEKIEKIFDTKTKISGQKLITLLDRLRLQSKKNYDEHGLHTLFLVIGEIRWKEQTVGNGSSDSTRVQDYNAPLLLIPVSLENTREPYKATELKISLDQNPVRINPVLLAFIKQSLDLRVPEIPEDLSGLNYEDLRKIISQLRAIFKERGISIEASESVYVGQFSFHGQQIYEDLQKNEDNILKHPFVYGICSGDPLDPRSSNKINIDESYNPDDFLNEDEDFTILDADESQIRTIKRIVAGENMVVHGPPGTGKSQTIANIISNLIARNKSVLFVCEKQVALDVVYKRLYAEGGASVADLCLPLFKYVSNKKDFAADIVKSKDDLLRAVRSRREDNLDTKIVSRKKKIEFLQEYAKEVTKNVEPLGKNLYWIFGQLGQIGEVTKSVGVSWKTNGSPLNFSIQELLNHQEALRDLNPYISFLNESDNQWNGVEKRHFSPDYVARIFDLLTDTQRCLEESPYILDGLQYHSLDKSIIFFERVTNDNFLRLNDRKLLRVAIKKEILQDHKAKFLLVTPFIEKYRTLNKDKRFNYAGKWQPLEASVVSTIKAESPIGPILGTAFEKSVEWLATTAKNFSRNLPNEIMGLSLDNLTKKSHLLGLETDILPLVKQSKLNLHDLVNQLKQLQVAQGQIQDAQEILNRHGVSLTSVSKQESLYLEESFSQKYRTFLRYFRPSFYKDRDTLYSWCGTVKPESYGELKTLCFAVSTRFKTEHTADKIWENLQEKFNLANEVRKISLESLVDRVVGIIEYQDSNSLEFVEPYFQDLLFSESRILLREKATMASRFITETKNIYQYLNCALQEVSLDRTEDLFISIQHELNNIRDASIAVADFVKFNPADTVGELLADVSTLNQLRNLLSEIEKYSLNEYVLISLSGLIEDETVVRDIFSYFDCLLEISEMVLPLESNVLAKAVDVMLSRNIEFDKWNKKLEAIITELALLFENEKVRELYLGYTNQNLISLIENLKKDKEGLSTWIEYKKTKHLCDELGLGWFLKELELKIQSDEYDIAEIYYWTVLNKWLEDYFKDKPLLRDFSKQKYQKIIEEFRKLEEESLEINRHRVIRQYSGNLQSTFFVDSNSEYVIKKEANKKMRHLPIRKIVQDHASYLQTIKPCWMVSPLALGSYLEYGKVKFDVVIFDEASQMRIENALGAISRGSQVIVIGDEHQLPPTSFFGFSFDDDEDEDEEVSEETGFESILQRAMSLLDGSTEHLRYHYRSASEDLIAFSNHYVYEGRLVTFPNANKRIDQGVSFEFVKGVYDGGKDGTKTNSKEAERVAELCIQFTEENKGTLGVIAFSRSQEKAIRDALEEKLKSYPHLAERLDETSTERDAFFIKNLESVQGDERDRIIISVCYGPDKLTGKVRNHFGPINQNGGYRRLNVAVTRAKEQLICVTSMRAYDMHPPETSRGAKLLQSYLEYAEKGPESLEASKIVQGGVEDADSEFELSVESELLKRGYKVKRQVGASGFKIDLAIVNPKNNTEYILGIECDGATYHSSKSARIRDRIRQDILERLGWKIYRIWSQHWSLHKDDILQDITNHL